MRPKLEDLTYDSPVDAAAQFICQRDWVTFVELQAFAESLGIPSHGDYLMTACPNGVMWADMSEAFCDLVSALQGDARVTVYGGSALAYMIDGGFLKTPVAKAPPRDRARGYAKPRWLPTFFRPSANGKP